MEACMTNARPSKQETERNALTEFGKAYKNFPEGTIKHGDKPDIIILGPRKVGIEITGFDLIDGGRSDSERQQKLRRDGVTMEARELYLNDGGRAIELTFGFQLITPKRRKELPAELAAFAKRIENKNNETIILEFNAAPKEVGFAWNAGEYNNATWKAQQVHGVGLMDKDHLERIIREKEMKARSYEQCDAYWLLIFVVFFDPAQDQEIGIDDPCISSTVFEKIFVFKTVFNYIVEVQ
jgi:hypothetical protein